MSHSLAFHTSALQERLRRGIGLLLASIATLLRGMTHIALLHCIKNNHACNKRELYSSCSIAKRYLYTRWKGTEIPPRTLFKSRRLSLRGYPGWRRIMMLPPYLPRNLSLNCSPPAKKSTGLGETPASALQKAEFIPLPLPLDAQIKNILFFIATELYHFSFASAGTGPGWGKHRASGDRGSPLISNISNNSSSCGFFLIQTLD